MSRTFVPRRPLAAAALLGTLGGFGLLSVTAAPARAQAPVTVNFNSLTPSGGSDYGYVNNCYQESGFQVTAVGLACGAQGANAFATVFSSAGPAYTGSPALFLNDPTATLVDFTRVGGETFAMQSVGLSPFGGPGSFGGGATTVTFIGSLFSGSTVMQTFNVSAMLAGLQTFSFSSAFTGLTSVRMSALDAYNEPIVQFDNLVFAPSASTVPEPTTVALLGGGLLAIGAAARRRRAARPQA